MGAWTGLYWTELVWLGSEYGQVAGFCEDGNELSNPIKYVEFLD